MNDFGDDLRGKMIRDLEVKARFQPCPKDVLVVVHNQLEYARNCLESIFNHTNDYLIYVWDNASDDETKDYLSNLESEGRIRLTRSDTNLGFIEPSNVLFSQGTSPFVILLNSDTEVASGWDEAMIAYLQQDSRIAEVGYEGGLLDENGKGGRAGEGYEIDFVVGWCCALRRVDIQGNLFDSENLTFAYAEDSDLSLRLKERDAILYALYLDLVIHHGSKTTTCVYEKPEGASLIERTSNANHEYIRRRWSKYLECERVDLHLPSPGL